MPRYLLSIHTGNGAAREPMTAEQIEALEAEMRANALSSSPADSTAPTRRLWCGHRRAECG